MSANIVITNYLDILPDNCMELIMEHMLDIACDEFHKSINDTIEKLVKVVQHHYEQVKYIKNSQKIFKHAWTYSFLRSDLLKI